MIFKLRQPVAVLRPRVTPDPQQAAELQRRMSALAYCPENGFHRDQSAGSRFRRRAWRRCLEVSDGSRHPCSIRARAQ